MQKVYHYLKHNIIFNSLFINSILISFLFFGANFSINYATDNYDTFMNNDVWKYMIYENGRCFNGMVYWIFSRFHFSPMVIHSISYSFAILFLILSIFLLSKMIFSIIGQPIISCILAATILCNPLLVEYFFYIDKGLFLFSLFCVVLAFYYTVSYYKTHNPKALLLPIIALLFAVNSYQIMMAVFVLLCLPFLLYFSQSIKNFFIYNIITAALYGFPLGIGLFITKILLNSSRVGQSSNLFYSITSCLKGIKEITFDRFYHLPNNFFLYFLFLFCIFAFLFWLKSSHKIVLLFMYFYIILGTIIVSFFPFITGVTGGYRPRTVYPYGCIMGIIALTIFLFSFKQTPNETSLFFGINTYKKSICILCSCFLLGSFLIMQTALLDLYRCNQTDKYICQMIGERIKEYENNSGQSITTICFYKDQSLTWGIDGTNQNGMIDRAHAMGWSNLTSINYYLGTQYQKGTPLSEYESYFTQYNWNYYSDEQLIFENNTLHFCVY